MCKYNYDAILRYFESFLKVILLNVKLIKKRKKNEKKNTVDVIFLLFFIILPL